MKHFFVLFEFCSVIFASISAETCRLICLCMTEDGKVLLLKNAKGEYSLPELEIPSSPDLKIEKKHRKFVQDSLSKFGLRYDKSMLFTPLYGEVDKNTKFYRVRVQWLDDYDEQGQSQRICADLEDSVRLLESHPNKDCIYFINHLLTNPIRYKLVKSDGIYKPGVCKTRVSVSVICTDTAGRILFVRDRISGLYDLPTFTWHHSGNNRFRKRRKQFPTRVLLHSGIVAVICGKLNTGKIYRPMENKIEIYHALALEQMPAGVSFSFASRKLPQKISFEFKDRVWTTLEDAERLVDGNEFEFEMRSALKGIYGYKLSWRRDHAILAGMYQSMKYRGERYEGKVTVASSTDNDSDSEDDHLLIFM